MKILMISEYFHPKGKGGGEISAFLLAKKLAKSGLEIHVLTSYFEGLKKEEIIENVKIHRRLQTGENPSSVLGNLKRNILFEKSLLKELKIITEYENFDIIHCMNITSIYAVKSKKQIKKPFVLHANSPVLFCPKATLMYQDKKQCDYTCTSSVFLKCYLKSQTIGKIRLTPFIKYNPIVALSIRKKFNDYQSLIKDFDYYLPISNFMKERLMKEGIDEKKISVLYNIIQLDKFQKLKQQQNKIKKILYLGEYTEPKGPHILIDALKEIKLPYEANFFGDGGLKEVLINETKKNNLNVKINEKAGYDKIPFIMQEHDIVVVPSLVGEAFGRVALEAIAAGKIVIASDVGGIGEIIINKQTGYLYREKKELISILNKLLSKGAPKLNPKIIKNHIKKLQNQKKVIESYNKLKNEREQGEKRY